MLKSSLEMIVIEHFSDWLFFFYTIIILLRLTRLGGTRDMLGEIC